MPWKCPNCGRDFKNPHQAHSCWKVDVEEHFENKNPNVYATFERLMEKVKTLGAVRVHSVKHAVMVRSTTTFLAIKPKKSYLSIEFLLPTEVTDFRIHKTFRVSKNRVAHFVILEKPEEVNSNLLKWLRDSYASVTK